MICSVKFPLKHSLIVASNTEKVLVKGSSAELNPDDMLRMRSKTLRHMSLSSWVPEESDKTVIITNSDERVILVHVHTVNMGTICA